jgi:Flp pilus assembly protein TadD
LRLNPHDADTHIALAQTLTLLGNTAGAAAHYQQALALGVSPDISASIRRLLAASATP